VLKGQPTENALLHLGLLSQINFPALYEAYPLERKQHDPEDWLYLKTVHRTSDHSIRICVKGRPADVLARCNRRFLHGQAHPLTETDVLEIEARNGQLAGKALRVVGLAFKDGHETADCDAENDLVWLGLVAMAEPIRKGVTSLIDRLHKAGIRTIMITGDQHASAYAVARAIGLSGKDHIKLLDSNELRSVQPELMKALAQDVDVYSRVNPAQKIRIVQALQQAGHIVAMTGDGINDGPALKAADIGIAMGLSGTDVARDVADMILEKDNIHTLIPAVKEGRDTYGNIKKSIRFLLATNFSTMLFTFAAISMGLGRPLNLAQTLSIDIIADIFPGLALCMEPPETDSLAHPPRNVRDPVFNSEDYRRMAFEASTLSLGSLMAYGYGIARYGMGIKTGNLAFQSLTIAKLLHAVSCRSTNYSMFDTGKLPSNRYLNLALGSALLLELISITIPGLRRFLGISRLNLLDIAIIGAGGFLPLCVNEATKTKMIRQH
jgi:Ca2+-transporting ATPase